MVARFLGCEKEFGKTAGIGVGGCGYELISNAAGVMRKSSQTLTPQNEMLNDGFAKRIEEILYPILDE